MTTATQATSVPPRHHQVVIPWTRLGTASHIAYALSYDPMGQGWIYFSCGRCRDTSQKPCDDPQHRLSHWVGWYAAQHAGC